MRETGNLSASCGYRETRKVDRTRDLVPDPSPLPYQIPGGSGYTPDQDVTGAWQEHAIHHFQGGSLARATTTQEHQGFSSFDIETEIVKDTFLTDASRNLSEGNKRTHELEATFPLQLSGQVLLEGHRACDRSVSGFGASRVWVILCSCRSFLSTRERTAPPL